MSFHPNGYSPAARNFVNLSELHKNDQILGHPEMEFKIYRAMLDAVRTSIVLDFVGNNVADTKTCVHAKICSIIASNPKYEKRPKTVKRIVNHIVKNETRISHLYQSLP
mmetsp:Transcript_69414/g.77637  ORF Transcript_69414/g.77637 Transcript_69414/m.77637 type:complete len:109 (-) Transcript_69414:148-474(-)